MLILANTFHGGHFETSYQTENGAIDHIFQFYLVRSAEEATIKSGWKKEKKKSQNVGNFISFFLLFLGHKHDKKAFHMS